LTSTDLTLNVTPLNNVLIDINFIKSTVKAHMMRITDSILNSTEYLDVDKNKAFESDGSVTQKNSRLVILSRQIDRDN
jgi:citrate lyase gamma subunit